MNDETPGRIEAAGGLVFTLLWVSDGARTRDILDHNQVLYLLSYTHHRPGKRASEKCTPKRLPWEPGVTQ